MEWTSYWQLLGGMIVGAILLNTVAADLIEKWKK